MPGPGAAHGLPIFVDESVLKTPKYRAHLERNTNEQLRTCSMAFDEDLGRYKM